MVALKRYAGKFMRSIFYVLPMIGITQELQATGGELLSNAYLLDVARMNGVSTPTTKVGKARRRGYHYIDVNHGQTLDPFAVIRSEPQRESLIRALDFSSKGANGSDGFRLPDSRAIINTFSGCAVGALIYHR
jgi:hypothetical protein